MRHCVSGHLTLYPRITPWLSAISARHTNNASRANAKQNFALALASHQEASTYLYAGCLSPSSIASCSLIVLKRRLYAQIGKARIAAYVAARQAEDLLVALGAGAVGCDAILKEGRDAAIRDGFALTRLGLGRRGGCHYRARTSERIGGGHAVQCPPIPRPYQQCRTPRTLYGCLVRAFVAAQANIAVPRFPVMRGEDDQRQIMLERTASSPRSTSSF